MNFLSHAAVAFWSRPEPRFILGSMLPDLLGMAGLKGAAVRERTVAAGVECHKRADDVFHASVGFRSLLSAARSVLAGAGLGRGSTLGASHAGIELLLDGWLVADREVLAAYRSALGDAAVDGAGDWIRWKVPDGAARWNDLRRRLLGGTVPEGYRDAAFAAERLAAILARRPRLALDDAGERIVRDWMVGAQREVHARAEEILRTVMDGLRAAPTARPPARGADARATDSRRS